MRDDQYLPSLLTLLRAGYARRLLDEKVKVYPGGDGYHGDPICMRSQETAIEVTLKEYLQKACTTCAAFALVSNDAINQVFVVLRFYENALTTTASEGPLDAARCLYYAQEYVKILGQKVEEAHANSIFKRDHEELVLALQAELADRAQTLREYVQSGRWIADLTGGAEGEAYGYSVPDTTRSGLIDRHTEKALEERFLVAREKEGRIFKAPEPILDMLRCKEYDLAVGQWPLDQVQAACVLRADGGVYSKLEDALTAAALL